jgi:hypothetical protein
MTILLWTAAFIWGGSLLLLFLLVGLEWRNRDEPLNLGDTRALAPEAEEITLEEADQPADLVAPPLAHQLTIPAHDHA